MEKDNQITLLASGKRGMVKVIFGRTGIIVLSLAIQIVLLLGAVVYFREMSPYYFAATTLLSVAMVIREINAPHEPTVKITWIVLIMLLPAFGSLLYVFIEVDIGHRALKYGITQMVANSKDQLPAQHALLETLAAERKGLYNLCTYLHSINGYVPYENTQVTYFPLGENKFEEMLRQLEQAKTFIFLEYFIVDEGYMWGRVLNILVQKAREGVNVRLMYDGTCAFSTLPQNYPKKIRAMGIQCKMFSPILPFLSTHYNYRDHRKILVVDGHTAFTGGINLADEYINRKQKHGHWKDTAIMLKGEAVQSFTLMFLQLWSLDEKNRDFTPYLHVPMPELPPEPGIVIPFGTSPLDNERAGEKVYLDILNRAENYVHIMSPYLILDGEMTAALQYAAKRGVDIKLILPRVPDKTYVQALAKNHYNELISAGVKIYEYLPGFVHAKVFVSDDVRAVVGTINLDYRSLYHHFECAAYLENVAAIGDITADMQDTLTKCKLITIADIKKENPMRRLIGRGMRVLAPLM